MLISSTIRISEMKAESEQIENTKIHRISRAQRDTIKAKKWMNHGILGAYHLERVGLKSSSGRRGRIFTKLTLKYQSLAYVTQKALDV